MSRLRKGSRVWRDDEVSAASRVLVECAAPIFSIDPLDLFDRAVPLEIELGAGRGDFILERAAAAPERNFLAVELASTIAQLMAVRAGRSGLENLKIVRMDARTLVNLMLPEASVDAFHIYFPDPWPKERHVKHRMFTPWFAASLKRKLRPDAPLFVATDVAEYAQDIFALLEECGFARIEMPVPGADSTGFARRFRAAGKPIYAGAFVAAEIASSATGTAFATPSSVVGR
jgi:tRNA (guanine-N7-)-methyltransferase